MAASAAVEISPADILDALDYGEEFESSLTVAPGTESSGDAAAQEQAEPQPESPQADTRWTVAEFRAAGLTDKQIFALNLCGQVKDGHQLKEDEKPPFWLKPETLDDAARVVRLVKKIKEDIATTRLQMNRKIGKLERRLKVYEGDPWQECIEIVKARLPKNALGEYREKNIDHPLCRLQIKDYQESVTLANPEALVTYMETLEANLKELRKEIARLAANDDPTDLQILELDALNEKQSELVGELRVLVESFRLTIVTREILADDEAWQTLGQYPQPGSNESYEKGFDAARVVAYVRHHEPILVSEHDLETGEIKETKQPYSIPGIVRQAARTELYPA